MKISGNIVDIHNRRIFPGTIILNNQRIESIIESNNVSNRYIIPGLIDAHIHIESSMLTPQAFAAAAVPRGTIGVVSDPHEIANVMGIDGVEFMMRSGEKAPFYFWFGAPSCVPATVFETSGASLDARQTEYLLSDKRILYLSEMMNWPGVVFDDKEVKEKIKIARSKGKPVDGHAPELRGDLLKKYVEAGITTDHECSTIEEALEKISLGMKVIIREGSAARNLEKLKELYRLHPGMVMLCSDDLHPEMLNKRHISSLVTGLIGEGYDLYDVLRSVTLNPVKHYNLESGLLREGDYADFAVVDNLESFNVAETWIKGRKVYENGRVNFTVVENETINRFNSSFISPEDLLVQNKQRMVNVIQAFDGELFTRRISARLPGADFLSPDIDNDILKIVVKDRYGDQPAAVGFIKGIGLKRGAFGGTVAHDSHNIICVGTNDTDILNCVNKIIENKGGLAVSDQGITDILPLEIAGLMSVKTCGEVAEIYEKLSERVHGLGSGLLSPFMTLSFMALLVIPEIKLSDKGLFDGKEFKPISLYQ